MQFSEQSGEYSNFKIGRACNKVQLLKGHFWGARTKGSQCKKEGEAHRKF